LRDVFNIWYNSYAFFFNKQNLHIFKMPQLVTFAVLYVLFLMDYCFDYSYYCLFLPVYNAFTDKFKILSENKGKSGVYLFKNLTNGKYYVGSAVDLSKRLAFYYKEIAMKNSLKRGRSHIYSAILKNGHSNFSLEILEYCSPEQCIEREDFYIKLLSPSYNILEKAGSSLGFKHSNESIKIMSDVKKGANHPMFGKPKPQGAGNPNQKIEVTDLETQESPKTYDSMSEVSKALDIPQGSISMYFKQNQKKPYKKRYIFRKVD